MANILIHIIAWAFGAFVCIGVLGLVVIMVQTIRSFFRHKLSEDAPASMPWWVWWSAHNNH